MKVSVRNEIEKILKQSSLDSANLSLHFDRLCRNIDEPNDTEKGKAKAGVISKMIAGYCEETYTLYKYALQRWRKMLEAEKDTLCFEMETTTPLVVGMGERNVHEFGMTFLLPWATPVIPGSAIKGVLSTYSHCYGGPEWSKGCFDSQAGSFALTMFGGIHKDGKAVAGCLAFLDAWWSPRGKKPFAEDIINVHYPSYYNGDDPSWPDGTDSPVPNKFLHIKQGERFLFGIRGPRSWRETAAEILKTAATENGFGAKTRLGYGRLAYCETPEEIRSRMASMTDLDLAAFFELKKSEHKFTSLFVDEIRGRSFSAPLRQLFQKFRPAGLLLNDLQALKPKFRKEAGELRKRSKDQLPSKSIDPADPDIRKIFDYCCDLEPSAPIQGTWLEAFKYTAADVIKEMTGEELGDFIVGYNRQWPPLADFKAAIINHHALSDKEREEYLALLEMRLEDSQDK